MSFMDEVKQARKEAEEKKWAAQAAQRQKDEETRRENEALASAYDAAAIERIKNGIKAAAVDGKNQYMTNICCNNKWPNRYSPLHAKMLREYFEKEGFKVDDKVDADEYRSNDPDMGFATIYSYNHFMTLTW